jgi:cysteine-rich repeat protein
MNHPRKKRNGKVYVFSVVFLVLMLSGFVLAVALSVNFVSPTPPDSAITDNTSVDIAVEVNGGDLSKVVYNWNGIDYFIYDNSLIGMFNLDTFTGSSTPDSSLLGNDGTLHNGATIQPFSSKYYAGLGLDGVDDYVNVAGFPSMNGATAFTFSAWIKPSSLTKEMMITSNYKASTNTGAVFQTRNASGVVDELLCSTAGNQLVRTTSANLQTGQWYHVVCIYDGTQVGNLNRVKIYVNGILQNTVLETPVGWQNIPSSISADTDVLQIGADTDLPPAISRFFNGSIDEVRVWNRALGIDEINQLSFTNFRNVVGDEWKLEVEQKKNFLEGLDLGNYTYQISTMNLQNESSETEERTLQIVEEVINCGNGVVDADDGEVCDDGIFNGMLGYCDQYCGGQTVPFCGDGVVSNDEDCDVGLASSTICNNQCEFTYCGDGVEQSPNGADFDEECDDGNNVDGDGCSSTCSEETIVNEENIEKVPINTCLGEGDLYFYNFINGSLNTSFVTQHDELYVLTRSDFISNVNVRLNGILATKSVVVDTVVPFSVKIYKVETTPGDFVEISDGSVFNARAIQGILTQDSANPAFNINAFNIVFDGEIIDPAFFTAGTYNYVFFDKYSLLNNGLDDSRLLNVLIEDAGNNLIVDETYNKPFPVGIEGAVVDAFTIPSDGMYVVDVLTQDSVYWFEISCPTDEPFCGDGNLDDGEECDDGNLNNNDGCNNECELEDCGDGVVQQGEECDDGNNDNNDSCNNECEFNEDEPFCGDGNIDDGEFCGEPGLSCGEGLSCNSESCTCFQDECEEDDDNDGVCDEIDMCLNSYGEVDSMGCDVEQFCGKAALCGPACDFADWMGDESELRNPRDCMTVIKDIEGTPYPRCVPVVLVCEGDF